MARPIQATPVLTGEDAERLLDSLKQTASAEEIASRMKAAREFVASVTKKPGAGSTEPSAAGAMRRKLSKR